MGNTNINDDPKSYGILSGLQILEEIQRNTIVIDPYDPRMVNPASVDLTLGNQVAVYKAVTHADFSCSPFDPVTGKSGIPGERIRPKTSPGENPGSCVLDSRLKNEVVKYTMDDRGFLLLPGQGYLMHTHERVTTDVFEPILDGKSSTGRLFCYTHVSAGFGDPGFDGQYTLEVVVVHPLIVYPGMKFCQIRFHTIMGEVQSYKKTGSYNGGLSVGPIPSQSWKQFSQK